MTDEISHIISLCAAIAAIVMAAIAIYLSYRTEALADLAIARVASSRASRLADASSARASSLRRSHSKTRSRFAPWSPYIFLMRLIRTWFSPTASSLAQNSASVNVSCAVESPNLI